MDEVIISCPQKAEASLAELAAQINVEHGSCDGLEHARQAGILLLQAKSRVQHGKWIVLAATADEVEPLIQAGSSEK